MAQSDNVVAMITGASGNLGNAAAWRFLQAGFNVALVDRAADRLQERYADLVGSNSHFLSGSVDVGDLEAMTQVVKEIRERLGRIDILVNTVGGYQAGTPLHQTPLETWDHMMNLNARSVFVACQAVIPVMLEQKYGKIVNVAARAGLSGSANSAAYCASKSAVIRLTESMGAELRGEGINVNCILPGTIDTPQNRKNRPDADFSRWVSPNSLAEVIFFLASDAAHDLYGTAVPVYGRS
jgi:NAD(P)-dependent dehydrogenase (short-subunit alcohol dehydrogenase family)